MFIALRIRAREREREIERARRLVSTWRWENNTWKNIRKENKKKVVTLRCVSKVTFLQQILFLLLILFFLLLTWQSRQLKNSRALKSLYKAILCLSMIIYVSLLHWCCCVIQKTPSWYIIIHTAETIYIITHHYSFVTHRKRAQGIKKNGLETSLEYNFLLMLMIQPCMLGRLSIEFFFSLFSLHVLGKMKTKETVKLFTSKENANFADFWEIKVSWFQFSTGSRKCAVLWSFILFNNRSLACVILLAMTLN